MSTSPQSSSGNTANTPARPGSGNTPNAPAQSGSTNTANSATNTPLDPEAVKQQAGQAAQDLKDQAQEAAGTAVEQVKQTATSTLDSQKDRATASLSTLADTLNQAGKQLDKSEGAGFFGQYVHQAASQVEALANHLDERDINALMADLESYAREQPAVFLGGAFVLGVLGARFLKSSVSGLPIAPRVTPGAAVPA